MDRQTAVEYHTELFRRLHERRPKLTERLLWVPSLAVSGFFAFDGFGGAIFGGLIGWGITAVLLNIDGLSLELTRTELLRHLYEHTDEAEEGQRIAKVQMDVEKTTKKWWHAR